MARERVRYVYIAGPYSLGDQAQNVRNAVLAGSQLLDLGFAPFIPHLTHFWHMLTPRSYDTWMRLVTYWLKHCDALIRLPGDSSEADKEVRAANALELPVYLSVDAFLGDHPRP